MNDMLLHTTVQDIKQVKKDVVEMKRFVDDGPVGDDFDFCTIDNLEEMHAQYIDLCRRLSVWVDDITELLDDEESPDDFLERERGRNDDV